MKHIVKIMTLVMAISALWVGLLQTSIIPRSHTWLVSDSLFILFVCLILFFLVNFLFFSYNVFLITSHALYLFSVQLPVYFVISLGCYGLLMVGVGLMQFPTCPQEALLLQQVVIITPLVLNL